jgi:hypothetical protein
VRTIHRSSSVPLGPEAVTSAALFVGGVLPDEVASIDQMKLAKQRVRISRIALTKRIDTPSLFETLACGDLSQR